MPHRTDIFFKEYSNNNILVDNYMNCSSHTQLEIIAHFSLANKEKRRKRKEKFLPSQRIYLVEFSVQWAQSHKFKILKRSSPVLHFSQAKKTYDFGMKNSRRKKTNLQRESVHAILRNEHFKKSSDKTMTTSATFCLTSMIWSNIFSH